jgi:hypothetical protein
MKSFLRSRDGASKGAALMIVLALVVLLTGLALAYFSRATTDRQLAQSSHNDTSADLLARSALDLIVGDFKQEIINGPATATSADIQPTPYGTPSLGQTPIPNLIRRSVYGVGLTSNVNSAPSPSATPRRGEITLARWNSHYLIPRANTGNAIDSTPVSSFVAPDWVLVTAQGPQVAPPPSAALGRYAFAVYDEGGLLDMNLSGYGNYAVGGGGGGSPPTPTPWAVNVGRKGVIGLADLTALPGSPNVVTPTTAPGSMGNFLTNANINSIVGWRNFANTGQSDNTFPSSFSFPGNLNKQDIYGSYLLDFGDAPYSSPSPFPTYPFTSVDTVTSNSRTDQAFMTRQDLLKLLRSIDTTGGWQNRAQYMGTFCRERNQPARDWGSAGKAIGSRLPDRFDITNLGLVKPNPGGTPKPNRGKGQPKGVGRGRYRGDALSILDLFGLTWIPAGTNVTDPHQIAYWPHWRYVGRPGLPNNCDPGQGCDHIPALRGGRNDFFQILDYAIKGQANGDIDDTVNTATILGLGASLIDQYDTPDLDVDTNAPPARQTHTTIIQWASGAVLGWENNDSIDPHASTALNKPTPAPSPTPGRIVLNHAFTTTADLGYGLKTEEGFTPLDLRTAGNNDSVLLDFFTFNPVDHQYPRLGIVNLNTKNPPVLAAILKSALKKDIDQPPPLPNPFPTVSQSEAMAAAQAIVTETWINNRPVLTRADIARLTSMASSSITNPGYTGEEQQKLSETISRALSELGQGRTWNLLIDVIAQTGKYAPDATNVTQANKFVVQGEKRYWLHIALGRDLVSGQVDVLGTQLEGVVE